MVLRNRLTRGLLLRKYGIINSDPIVTHQNLAIGALPNTSFPFISATFGAVIVRFTTPSSISSRSVIVSTSSSSNNNNWFEIGIDSDSRIYVEKNSSGLLRTLKGSAILNVSTNYTLVVVYDGTDYYLRLNGIEENPLTLDNYSTSPGWFGGVTSGNTTTIGATIHSGGTVRSFSGAIKAIEFYAEDIT